MPAIRSISRALLILRAMNEKALWSLQDLQARTGLPKSTVHRILAALQEERLVRCDEGMYGHYQLTSEVRELSKGVVQSSQLTDVAAPILVATTKRIKWPLSIGVVDGTAMRVAYCTMPYSPYAVRPSSFGRRYGLFDSALGAAYFSYCGRGERRILVERLRSDGLAAAIPPAGALRALVRTTRRRGYGLRLGRQASESSAFAVPIAAGDALLGSLSYSTFSRTLDDALLQRFLPVLRETAGRIGEEWARAEAAVVP